MAKGARGRGANVSRDALGRIGPGGAEMEPPGDAPNLAQLGLTKKLLAANAEARLLGFSLSDDVGWLGALSLSTSGLRRALRRKHCHNLR